MSERGKMTPGPWTMRETSLGYATRYDAVDPQGRTVELHHEANARAVACLPELVEAARAALKALELADLETPAWDLEKSNLRRILARIDGGD